MAAILGEDRAAVYAACRDYRGPGVVGVACHNAPGQTVISGSSPAVEAVADALEEAGFGVAALAVSVATHSSLLAAAAEALVPFVIACPCAAPKIPVIDNVTAQSLLDAVSVRESILRQLTEPVLFEESVALASVGGVGTNVRGTRIAMNGYPDLAHNYEAPSEVAPARGAGPGRGGRGAGRGTGQGQ